MTPSYQLKQERGKQRKTKRNKRVAKKKKRSKKEEKNTRWKEGGICLFEFAVWVYTLFI
jgi:hypothetical protein